MEGPVLTDTMLPINDNLTLVPTTVYLGQSQILSSKKYYY